jgi:hypothetical protein
VLTASSAWTYCKRYVLQSSCGASPIANTHIRPFVNVSWASGFGLQRVLVCVATFSWPMVRSHACNMATGNWSDAELHLHEPKLRFSPNYVILLFLLGTAGLGTASFHPPAFSTVVKAGTWLFHSRWKYGLLLRLDRRRASMATSSYFRARMIGFLTAVGFLYNL